MILKKGLDIIKDYFKDKIGKVVIPANDFKNLVKRMDFNENLVLLSISNFIVYKFYCKCKKIHKFSPSPSASHVIVSKFPVGACVLGKSGKVYLGANFEFNNSLSISVHAEQCAVHNAIINNEKCILKIASNITPCGMCRQYLIELGNPNSLDVIFNFNNKLISKKLSELIPNSFTQSSLLNNYNLFNYPKNKANFKSNFRITDYDNITIKAINKAYCIYKKSYTPYSKSPSSTAIIYKDKSIVYGQDIENAAFNPSLSSIRGAFSLGSLMGKNINCIKTIVILVLDSKEALLNINNTLIFFLNSINSINSINNNINIKIIKLIDN